MAPSAPIQVLSGRPGRLMKDINRICMHRINTETTTTLIIITRFIVVSLIIHALIAAVTMRVKIAASILILKAADIVRTIKRPREMALGTRMENDGAMKIGAATIIHRNISIHELVVTRIAIRKGIIMIPVISTFNTSRKHNLLDLLTSNLSHHCEVN